MVGFGNLASAWVVFLFDCFAFGDWRADRESRAFTGRGRFPVWMGFQLPDHFSSTLCGIFCEGILFH